MRRREFLSVGAAGLGAAALSGAAERLVRLGIVGTGNRGTYLLRLLLGIPGTEVSAVCDLSPDNAGKAAAIAGEARGRTPVLHTGPSGYGEMLARPEIDAVLISTPTRSRGSTSTTPPPGASSSTAPASRSTGGAPPSRSRTSPEAAGRTRTGERRACDRDVFSRIPSP